MKSISGSSSRRSGKSKRTRTTSKRRAAAKTARMRVIDLVPAMIKLRRILVPIDFSPSAEKALTYAISFSEQFGAKITLVNVIEPAVYPTEFGYVPPEIDTLYRTMENTAREKVTNVAEQRIPGRFRSKPMVRVGKPHAEISKVAKELRCDLIVIGTHGYTGIKHTVMGSTAERVVRHAPCPVLTVREGEHDFV